MLWTVPVEHAKLCPRRDGLAVWWVALETEVDGDVALGFRGVAVGEEPETQAQAAETSKAGDSTRLRFASNRLRCEYPSILSTQDPVTGLQTTAEQRTRPDDDLSNAAVAAAAMGSGRVYNNKGHDDWWRTNLILSASPRGGPFARFPV